MAEKIKLTSEGVRENLEDILAVSNNRGGVGHRRDDTMEATAASATAIRASLTTDIKGRRGVSGEEVVMGIDSRSLGQKNHVTGNMFRTSPQHSPYVPSGTWAPMRKHKRKQKRTKDKNQRKRTGERSRGGGGERGHPTESTRKQRARDTQSRSRETASNAVLPHQSHHIKYSAGSAGALAAVASRALAREGHKTSSGGGRGQRRRRVEAEAASPNVVHYRGNGAPREGVSGGVRGGGQEVDDGSARSGARRAAASTQITTSEREARGAGVEEEHAEYEGWGWERRVPRTQRRTRWFWRGEIVEGRTRIR
ncbi:hypothetical protein BDK51DRAFT_35097 [Blyttiomyces helicus]|uniref:Uncharacterized protein n=1 Tax=Blyttiomyces helicus TaxID=388810 RepID=A0A4V1IRV7_9FUNG|nr:hypothetical protein BDK51DRAFT_35097 [Blyttiomyces helicus]|eukprot:RKO91397.1 hypothetical protein BDK51DRAFT_35097 [Blyttiomyces helicus]